MRLENCRETSVRDHRFCTSAVLKLSTIVLLAMGSTTAWADQVIHRFDFGNYGQAVEPGWTDQHYYTLFDNALKIAGKRQFAGNLVGEYSGITPPTFTPIEVMRDWFSTYNLGGPPEDPFDGPTPFIFRDYAPDYTTGVKITIYRSSEGDPFSASGDVLWSTSGADDPIDNTWSVLDYGDLAFSAYHAPITDTFLTPGLSRIDFKFKGYLDTMRVNGIELIYTVPEPACIALITLGVPMLMRRRCHVA